MACNGGTQRALTIRRLVSGSGVVMNLIITGRGLPRMLISGLLSLQDITKHSARAGSPSARYHDSTSQV